MKIMVKILGIIFPLILIINLYRFLFTASTDNYTFVGLHAIFEYFKTFNGFNSTLEAFEYMKGAVNDFVIETESIDDLVEFFKAFGQFWMIVGSFFKFLFAILRDLLTNVLWFFQMITGQI